MVKMSDSRRPVIIVDDVHVKYRTFATGKKVGAKTGAKILKGTGRTMRTVHALKGVSFAVYQGESIGIIGSNGSGKSTLMRTMTGGTPASQGSVYAASRPSLLGVGAPLLRDLSGEKNVILSCLALGYSMDEVNEVYDDIVDFAGLREFIDMPMRSYSSGMVARLKFAIATSKRHEILIVDEALSVGDREFRERSESRIAQIRESAGTVLLVSHSMNSIREACDRVIWINQGNLMMDGDPETVIAAYENS